MSGHPIVHIEFSARDPKKAGTFYSELFGWKTEAVPEMSYVTFDVEPGPGGGFPATDEKTYKPGDVIVYVQTDNIDATLAKAEKLGGKKLLGKTDIPGMGWYAFFADPTGNRVGLFTGLPPKA